MGNIVQNLSKKLLKIDEDFEKDRIKDIILRKKLLEVSRELERIAKSR